MRLLISASLLFSVVPLCAGPINPTVYSMLNGESGLYSYWDTAYPDPDNTSNLGLLTGGLGELTDGIKSPDSWFPSPNNPGPWVAWQTIDPSLTFSFAQSNSFNSITVHVDDPDGDGGVNLPAELRVTIGGNLQTFGFTDLGSGPRDYTFALGGAIGSMAEVQFVRGAEWVFVDEVSFDGSGVPEPSTFGLLAAGLTGIVLRLRLVSFRRTR